MYVNINNNNKLRQGSKFQSRNGMRVGVVGQVLGEGGQGIVYDVDLDGGKFALKWYHNSYIQIDTGLYTRLSKAVERGAPDNRFLWPLEIVHISDHQSFGYIMPLRDPSFVGMRDLIAPPPKRVDLSLAQRIKLCSHIAQSFLELHSSGFCYQDINFGNIFFNAKSAEVLICDNDNVNIDGADASIYGTRKFMAPEVVRREVLPSTKTDLFSMAVMFFYVVFGWHPLDGRREANIKILDAKAELLLYGAEPVFIFDTINPSNGPVESFHDAIVYRWNSLPEALRQLFVRSFTLGLFSPGQRVLENEWQNAFAAVPSAIFNCPNCDYEHVAGFAESTPPKPELCVCCTHDLSNPPTIRIGRQIFVVKPEQTIPLQALGYHSAKAWESAGIIEEHPDKPGIFGLRNLMATAWKVSPPGQKQSPVPPGRTVRIIHGMQIDFGNAKGIVVTHTSSHLGTAET
jgi:DNA-binding helix-hairpin-helix protein with protein kinase domain